MPGGAMKLGLECYGEVGAAAEFRRWRLPRPPGRRPSRVDESTEDPPQQTREPGSAWHRSSQHFSCVRYQTTSNGNTKEKKRS